MSQPAPILAYISQIRWPSEIPAGPFNANFMVSMANAGVEVHFIVRSATDSRAEKYNDPLDVLRGEYGHESPGNLHIHVIPTPGWKPASDRGLFLLRAGWLLRRLRRDHGVNCVMSRDTLAVSLLDRWHRRGLVSVHDSHNFYMDPAARDDAGRGYPWNHYPRLEKRHLPRIDGLLALLETQAEWYRKELAIPVVAAHPGVTRTDPPDNSRFEKKTIGYVGSLAGIKGSMEILEAFKALPDPKTRLLLIGGRGAEETAAARARIHDMGLADRVEVTGWLSVPELQDRMRELSVALLPLQDRFYNRYLTAPSKLFDYLGQAVPVIASDLPAVRELAGAAAEYVPPGDTQQLTNAMHRLLTDADRHNELSRRAYRRAGELRWDRRGVQTREFLSDLLAKR